MLLALDNTFAALDNTFNVSDNNFLRCINQKQKRVIQQEYILSFCPTQIRFIHLKYVLPNVNSCNPALKPVIQREYLLTKIKTCYLMQQMSYPMQ